MQYQDLSLLFSIRIRPPKAEAQTQYPGKRKPRDREPSVLWTGQ